MLCDLGSNRGHGTRGDPGEDPGHDAVIMSLEWPGNTLGVLHEKLEELSGEREVWAFLLIHYFAQTFAPTNWYWISRRTWVC